jgi:hypothetical protein
VQEEIAGHPGGLLMFHYEESAMNFAKRKSPGDRGKAAEKAVHTYLNGLSDAVGSLPKPATSSSSGTWARR